MEEESPVTNIAELFPQLQRVPIEIGNDPKQNFTVYISFGTLHSMIKVVVSLHDYTALQMVEMLIIFHSFFFL